MVAYTGVIEPVAMDRRLLLPILAMPLLACAACTEPDPAPPARPPSSPALDWPCFGGPSADFSLPDPGLATSWPRGGPRRIWRRQLGPGYSGIVTGGGQLFTMYRDGVEEVVVCLDAATGETRWEHRYAGPPARGHDSTYGDGPNGTPLLAGGRLYTIGIAGTMHCLDAATGELLWSRDLWTELGGTVLELGYSSSPAAYEDKVIVLVGGQDRGVVALDQQDGSVVWAATSFENSYSTPLLARFHGRDQLIAFMATEVVGVDPRDGVLLWRYPIRNHYPQNICLPLRLGDDLLFVSTLEAGSRGLRLRAEGPPRVEEAWSTTRLQCFYSATVRLHDRVYGVSGYQASPRMTALDARTGELLWRKRGFAVGHLLAVGDRLLLLDEDGKLTLASPGEDGLVVHAEAQLLAAPARTPPTLVGRVLYARDLATVVAVEL